MKLSTLFTVVSAAPQPEKRIRREVPADWEPDCPNRNSINWVPGDCTKFYLCDRGIPNVIQTCGPGTAYSTTLKVCVFPFQADCDAAFRQPVTTTTTTTTQAPTEAPTETPTTTSPTDQAWTPDCAVDANGVNFVPGVCTDFYLCDRGIPNVIQTCGPGTVYSPQLKVCVFPSQTDCDAAFRQPGAAATTGAPATTAPAPTDQAWTPDCAVDANGINFVPGVCTDFYLCDRGIPNVVQTCGPGTVYSPQLKVCVFPSQTDCDAAFRQPGATVTTTSAPNTEAASTTASTEPAWTPDCAVDSNGINFVPGVCTDFYLCDRGIPNVVQTCGPGTVYSPEFKVCVFPSQTDCDAAFRQPLAGATTTQAPSTTTTQAPTTTTEATSTTTTTTTTTQGPTEAPTEAPTQAPTTTTEATTTTQALTETPAPTGTTAPTSMIVKLVDQRYSYYNKESYSDYTH